MKRFSSAVIFIGMTLVLQHTAAQAQTGVSGVLSFGKFFQGSIPSDSYSDPRGLNAYHTQTPAAYSSGVSFTTPDSIGTYSTPYSLGTGTITNTHPGQGPFGSTYLNDPISFLVRFGSTTAATSSPGSYTWAQVNGQVGYGYQGSIPTNWSIYPAASGWSELMGGASVWSVSSAGQTPNSIVMQPVTAVSRYSGGQLSVAVSSTLTNVNNLPFGGPRGTLQADFNTSASFSWLAAGNSQSFPILPSTISNGSFSFFGVPSGKWFDPVTVPEFRYDMLGSSLFNRIDELPTGFNSPFTVKVGNTIIGNFFPGQQVDFVALLGGGVTSFSVSGIDPGGDPTSLTAFPLRISFNTATADFKMTGISASSAPEPGTLALIGLGLVMGAGRLCKRRKVL